MNLFTNKANSKLSASINATTTSIPLSSGSGGLFPAPQSPDVCHITLEDPATGSVEICKVTSRSVDILTVVRGQDNTIAQAFPVGTKVELRIIAMDMNYIMNTLRAHGKVLVPTGGIIMWDQPTIPTGWAICDGTNGTPDLRDKFVLAAGTNTSVGSTGGNRDATLVAHTHTATSSSTFAGQLSGAHTHAVTDIGHTHSIANDSHQHAVGMPALQPGQYGEISGQASRSQAGWGNAQQGTNSILTSAAIGQATISGATTGVSVGASSSGTPTGTVDTTTSVSISGVAGADGNMPPYYVLYFIKLIATNT